MFLEAKNLRSDTGIMSTSGEIFLLCQTVMEVTGAGTLAGVYIP